MLLRDPRTRRVVELNHYPPGSRFGGRYRSGDEVDHLDFTIGPATVGTLKATYRRLIRAGGRPTGYHPGTTAGWMASVRDPDGIWITVGRRPTPAERRAMARTRSG